MNQNLEYLQSYPFQKLKTLKSNVNLESTEAHIALSIGEPKHAPPQFVLESLIDNIKHVSHYPSTIGLPSLREAIADWATRRFTLSPGTLSPEKHILPLNGTREGLFAFAQACINTSTIHPKVLMPNPFYQIYEGATLLAGAEPIFLNCHEENGFVPDFDAVTEETWKACQLLFICTPGNPSGSVMSIAEMKSLIELADKYDFVIASDECYSELYFDEHSPPPGILQACREMGRNSYSRCVAFHSLSKRSNLPGLRSGFVAGDADLINHFLRYRTYHGCAMPTQTQLASIAAWQDEQHVIENRNLYREKFSAVLDVLNDVMDIAQPEASFYLWPKTPIPDTHFAQQLYAQENVTVVPGTFLARCSQNINPGENRVRMALVASLEECVDGANRIKRYLKKLG